MNNLKVQKEKECFSPFSMLGPGKHFGDLALFIQKEEKNNDPKPVLRAATIKCVTECSFATLSK